MYKWQSTITGEIVRNIWEVLIVIWEDLTRFHILNIKWEYRKEGF